MSEQFNKYYNVRIKLRNDSWANWKSKENDFCPYDGEIIIYDILKEADAAALEMTPVPYQLIKIGDGETKLKDLPFINEMSSAMNITSGSKNGTISVMGNDVWVKGLDDKDIMCFEDKNDYALLSQLEEQYNTLNGRIDTNASVIEEEKSTRKQSIESLQNQINGLSGGNEGTSLFSLQSQLNNEVNERTEGQKNLEEAIDVITSNYIKSDGELNGKITTLEESLTGLIRTEAAIREQRDKTHTDNIQEHKASIEDIEKEIKKIEEEYVVSLTSNENKTQYTFSQKGNTIGTVNVPLECYVIDGSVERNQNKASLKLNLKNITDPVFINASSLIDIYTHKTNASEIQVNIDNDTKIISASLVDRAILGKHIAKNTIEKESLEANVQKILDTAALILGDSIGSVDTKFEELKNYIDEKTMETGVVAGTYGQLNNISLTSGSTFTIPQFAVDSYGKLTKAYNWTCTMPVLTEIFINGYRQEGEVGFYAPMNKGNEYDMLIFTNDLPVWVSSYDHILKFLNWTNVSNKPVASNDTLGLIKIGYTENNKNYALKLNGDNQAYVTVPWEGVLNISTGTANGTISVNTSGTIANVAVKGLGSNAYNSTAYLPLAGGTVTGVTTFSNTTASTSTTTGAVKISGGLGVAGTVYGKTIYGAVYNDYAEYRSSEKVVPGNCICDDYDGIMKKTTKRLQPACKIVSDTFGFAIGQTEKCKTPTAVCGRVLAIPYEERETYSIGDCVCSGPNGTISRMTREEIVDYPDRIVGIVSEIPNYNIWGEDDIQVNGRIWIYVR